MRKSTETDSRIRVTDRYTKLRQAKPFVQGQELDGVFTIPEKTLWLIESVDAVMGNGPFEEFFTRPVSRYLKEITEAYVRVGAIRCANVFEEAIGIFLPDLEFERHADVVEIGKARELRWEMLSESESELLDSCFVKFMEFAETETLMTRLEQYLHANEATSW